MTVLDLSRELRGLRERGAALDPRAAARAEDRQLIDRAVAGDAHARAELGRRIRPVLRARVQQFLKGRRPPRLGTDDADDLVQLIWLRLAERNGHALSSFDPRRGMSLEGYVALIARRELHRRHRELASQRRCALAPPLRLREDAPEPAALGPCPEQRTADRQQVQRLMRHLQRELPARGKLVFAALYVDGLSAPEAARMLDVRPQVIYNWQHRIRSLARTLLASDER